MWRNFHEPVFLISGSLQMNGLGSIVRTVTTEM